MSARSIFGTVQNLSVVLRDLEDAGMRIVVGDDFALYRYYRSTCANRGDISPVFDTASSFIDETNGFWICGFNELDELVHTQAVRLLDLSGITLGKHLDMHRHKYIVPDTTPDPDLTFFQGPEALKTVTGSVGYCGDFWLPSHGLGGPRSHGATSLLSRLLFEILQQVWKPDFVFAFVPRYLATKGAHLRYGYTHCEPGAWVGPDKQITNEEYLIWMNASDIKGVIARDIQSIRKAAHVAAMQAPLTSIDTTG